MAKKKKSVAEQHDVRQDFIDLLQMIPLKKRKEQSAKVQRVLSHYLKDEPTINLSQDRRGKHWKKYWNKNPIMLDVWYGSDDEPFTMTYEQAAPIVNLRPQQLKNQLTRRGGKRSWTIVENGLETVVYIKKKERSSSLNKPSEAK